VQLALHPNRWSTAAGQLMPELPEVESAVQRLRAAAAGKTIAAVAIYHPSLRKRLSPAKLRSLRGERIHAIERRGKHQLFMLEDGRTLHAHFRMTGDWHIDGADDELPRFARAAIVFDDGSRVVLEDPRALSTLDLHAANDMPDLGLGPEPGDPLLTPVSLLAALSKKRGPIKPVLLDQRVIAGLGNIYAAESLWHARISPAVPAASLTVKEATTLLAAIRRVIDRATGARYTDASVSRLAVYDRAGKPCRRCRTPVARVVQAGRSTYFCPSCQSSKVASRKARS
jgi:formamidopyrimidine-DNA glycosylase